MQHIIGGSLRRCASTSALQVLRKALSPKRRTGSSDGRPSKSLELYSDPKASTAVSSSNSNSSRLVGACFKCWLEVTSSTKTDASTPWEEKCSTQLPRGRQLVQIDLSERLQESRSRSKDSSASTVNRTSRSSSTDTLQSPIKRPLITAHDGASPLSFSCRVNIATLYGGPLVVKGADGTPKALFPIGEIVLLPIPEARSNLLDDVVNLIKTLERPKEYELMLSATISKISGDNYTRLADLAYRQVGPNGRFLAAILILLLYIHDDAVDDPKSPLHLNDRSKILNGHILDFFKKENAESVFPPNFMDDILNSPELPKIAKDKCKFQIALIEQVTKKLRPLVDESLKKVPDNQRNLIHEGFLRALELYLNACFLENPPTSQSIEDHYFERRERNSGVPVCFELLILLLAGDLSSSHANYWADRFMAFRSTEEYKQLVLLSHKHIVFANDWLSFFREMTADDVNIVQVFKKDGDTTYAEAYKQAADRCNGLYGQFKRIKGQVITQKKAHIQEIIAQLKSPGNSSQIDDPLHKIVQGWFFDGDGYVDSSIDEFLEKNDPVVRFINALEDWINANLQFSTNSQRYLAINDRVFNDDGNLKQNLPQGVTLEWVIDQLKGELKGIRESDKLSDEEKNDIAAGIQAWLNTLKPH